MRDLPPFRDLRNFLDHIASMGDLATIEEPVSLVHEMTELHRRVLHSNGPVLKFHNPTGIEGHAARMPVVVNLFGTRRRVAAAFGVEPTRLAELGEMLASLRDPRPPNGLTDILARWPMLRAALNMQSQLVKRAPVQYDIRRGKDVDLTNLPIQTCWPGEPAPLITWPLVITCPPESKAADARRYNVGVYRLQLLSRDRLIGRWLAHRGAAAHHRAWAAMGKDMPIAIAIGADPATMLSAVMPLPENISELTFAGLIRGERPRLAAAVTVPLLVPADAEIMIEGFVSARETAPEGPFGDHTGYHNPVEPFPVIRVTAITTRADPFYVSTYTSRPPDEPSVIGAALNDIALPLIRRQIPEIVDLWLPPAACSYRVAVVSITKRYPGQARRVMMALWGLLPQFSYTKAILVVDEDINVRSGDDLLWAISTRADPSRDLFVLDRTPIDSLDFASPEAGLGGKIGIDATNKIGSETSRVWGRPLAMSSEVVAQIDRIWSKLPFAANAVGERD